MSAASSLWRNIRFHAPLTSGQDRQRLKHVVSAITFHCIPVSSPNTGSSSSALRTFQPSSSGPTGVLGIRQLQEGQRQSESAGERSGFAAQVIWSGRHGALSQLYEHTPAAGCTCKLGSLIGFHAALRALLHVRPPAVTCLDAALDASHCIASP